MRQTTAAERRESRIGRSFIAPAMIGFAVLYVIPFLICIYYSLTHGVGLNLRFTGIDQYVRLFRNPSFWLGMRNSFLFIAIAVPLLIVASLILAEMMCVLTKGKTALRLPVLVPLVIPAASLITIWKFLFADEGTVNGLLSLLGVESISWLSERGAFWMLVMLFIWKYAGYCMLLFLAALSTIPPQIHQAAMLDGADAIRRFFFISLPHLIPCFSFVAIISVSNSFKIYREAFLLYGENPPDHVYMLQHFMQNSFRTMDFARLSSAAISLLVLFAALILTAYRIALKNRQEGGGLNG